MLIVSLKPTEPVRDPITKFGGQPVWLTSPMWPISRSTRQPMRFICQVRLPDGLRMGGQSIAYIFMTDGDEYVDGTWEPDGGENAVILQPSPFEPVVEVCPLSIGPTLTRMVPGVTGNRLVPEEVEYRAELQDLPDEAVEFEEYSLCTRIGGAPVWLQNDESPSGDWLFLMQIDSSTDAYSLNFGDAGMAYVFISCDGRRGWFLWQCC